MEIKITCPNYTVKSIIQPWLKPSVSKVLAHFTEPFSHSEGFYYFVIYWFFSWKIEVCLSASIAKRIVVKIIIVDYLENNETIYLLCIFFYSLYCHPTTCKYKHAQDSSILWNLLPLWPHWYITLFLLFQSHLLTE